MAPSKIKGYGAVDTDDKQPLTDGELVLNPGELRRLDGESTDYGGFGFIDNLNWRSRLYLQLMLVFCGISTFVRSESVLLQVQLFADCFDLGEHFYALASCAFFMPGIFVQLIQGAFDEGVDRKRGTAKASVFRVMVAMMSSASAELALICGAYFRPSLQTDVSFVYTMIVIMGIGVSISFGTINQLVSIFPVKFHAAFFFGCYAPFFILAPTNVAVGDLCAVLMSNSTSHEAMAGLDLAAPVDVWLLTGNHTGNLSTTLAPLQTTSSAANSTIMYETRWSPIFIYYGVAVAACVFGSMALVAALKHPVGRHSTKKKDHELRAESSSKGSLAQSLNGPEAENPPLLGNVSDLGEELPTDKLSRWMIIKKIWPFMLCLIFNVLVSTMIASFYIAFPISDWKDNPTLLSYGYYIACLIGVAISSFEIVRNRFGLKALVGFSVVRIAFLALAFLYLFGYIAPSDLGCGILNAVQMIIAGVLFSRVFSLASGCFSSPAAKSTAAAVMNVAYYVAMALSLGVTLLFR